MDTFYAAVGIGFSPSPCLPSPNRHIMTTSFLLAAWQVKILPILASMGWVGGAQTKERKNLF
jgi:hypothetical protein